MGNRFLIVGYTAKGRGMEFSSIKGYKLKPEKAIPPHETMREDCLGWANRDDDIFSYFQINFMNFVDESDYNSFMGLK